MLTVSDTSSLPTAKALSAPIDLPNLKVFSPMLKGDKSESNVEDWMASIHGTLLDFGAWDMVSGSPNYSV